jgi:hypothetical protein
MVCFNQRMHLSTHPPTPQIWKQRQKFKISHTQQSARCTWDVTFYTILFTILHCAHTKLYIFYNFITFKLRLNNRANACSWLKGVVLFPFFTLQLQITIHSNLLFMVVCSLPHLSIYLGYTYETYNSIPHQIFHHKLAMCICFERSLTPFSDW